MVSLDNGIIVLNRTQEAEAILPLVHPGKGGRGGAWLIDLGIEAEEVLNVLLDAEILDEAVPVRYIARNGVSFDAPMHIDELISDAEGHRARLRGAGPPPAALLGDEPQTV